MKKIENNYTEADYYSKNIQIGFEPYQLNITDNQYYTAEQTVGGNYLHPNKNWTRIRKNIPDNPFALLDQRYKYGRSVATKNSMRNNDCFGVLPLWVRSGDYTIFPANLLDISLWINSNIVLQLDHQNISTDLVLLQIAKRMLIKQSKTQITPLYKGTFKRVIPTEQQISELNLQLLDNWLRAKREWNTFCYAKQIADLPF